MTRMPEDRPAISRYDLARLACTLVGMFFLYRAIESAIQFAHAMWLWTKVSAAVGPMGTPAPVLAPMLQSQIVAALLVAVAYAVGGVIVIRNRHQLANWMFGEEPSGPPTDAPFALHAFAFSIVGIILVAVALSDLAGSLASAGFSSMLIRPLVRLAMGLALFFGSHRLVSFWCSWQRGLCAQCGYNLTGNTSGTCPECGTPLPGTPPPTPQVLLRDEDMKHPSNR